MGKITRDASQRLNYAISEVERKDYALFCQKLKTKFSLIATGKPVSGLDEIFQDYYLEKMIIGLEWDIWEGFMVVAKNKDAESLVKQIAEYLSSNP